MERTIGVTEARNRLGELVDRVRYQGDTVVLVKSGKPAAALVPYSLLEQWRKRREELFAVIDQIHAQNQDLDMNEEELMNFINEAVHEVRRLPKDNPLE
jgi:prevent-host-death family protein